MAVPNFVALDTETYKGKAFLLSCPHRVFSIRSFGDFLAAAKSLGDRFVFYNIDYDVSALLKHLPREIVGKIYLNRDIAYNGIVFRYIPGKVFRVTWEGNRLEAFDLFPFFQRSLNSVALEYLGKEKLELPNEIISDLSPRVYLQHKELVDSYAIRDAQLLQELCDKFYASVVSTGIRARALYSPGYLAKRYLRERGIRVSPNPVELERVTDLVYYGGRIEVAKRGFFPDSLILDLKSAYPWALRDMPDFGSARWYVSDRAETPFYLAEISAPVEIRNVVAPFPQRRNGLVFYPNLVSGTVWITSPEYECSPGRARRFVNFETGKQRPFKELIEELFSLRGSGDMESLVYKLILNSLYGVLAETRVEYKLVDIETSVRHLHKRNMRDAVDLFIARASEECPEAFKAYANKCKCEWCDVVRYASRRVSKMPDQRLLEFDENFYLTTEKHGRTSNRLLAAFVTGIVRAEIFRMATRAETSFIGCFTDSLLLESRIPLPKRGGLGAWEEKYSGPLWVVGSGVYETLEYTKFRGYRVPKGYLRGLLEKMSDSPVIRIPQKSRQSLGQMVRLSYDDYTEFNVLKDDEKNFDLNFDRKRDWPESISSGRDILEKIQASKPLLAEANPCANVGF